MIGKARSLFHFRVLESVHIKTKRPVLWVLCSQKEFVFSLGLFSSFFWSSLCIQPADWCLKHNANPASLSDWCISSQIGVILPFFKCFGLFLTFILWGVLDEKAFNYVRNVIAVFCNEEIVNNRAKEFYNAPCLGIEIALISICAVAMI